MDNVLKIIECKEDYKYEGPRYIALGPDSGEEFRDSYLIPWLDKNKKTSDLAVDFEGTIVYTPSFLEETFGGAIRKGYKQVASLKLINILDEQKKRVEGYIQDALNKIKK